MFTTIPGELSLSYLSNCSESESGRRFYTVAEWGGSILGGGWCRTPPPKPFITLHPGAFLGGNFGGPLRNLYNAASWSICSLRSSIYAASAAYAAYAAYTTYI